MVSSKSSSGVEFKIKKIFLKFVSFKELLGIEVLRVHGIFGMILFTFSVISLQIKIFSIKNSISKSQFRPKMNQFCVPYRLNGIKSVDLDSWGSSLSKKIRILFQSSFFQKGFHFFASLSHLENSYF